MRGCEFVRTGDTAEGPQGLLYAAGVTSTGRSRCHLHRRIDSAGLVAHSPASDQDGLELLPALDAMLGRGA